MSAVTTILIACWYYTSSSIAVSSQNIFRRLMSNTTLHSDWHTPLFI